MYNALCISSGGKNGTIFMGILHFVLENMKSEFDIKKIDYFIGTSAGSLILFLLIIGYTPIEILLYICKYDISNNFSNFCINNVTDGYGVYDNREFKGYIHQMIINKLGYIPTMMEFYNTFNKVFICTSYCLSRHEKVYFSHMTHPDLSCLDVLIASSSIPMMLTKHQINNEYYIDGAIFDHFPLNYLLNYLKEKNVDYSVLSIHINHHELYPINNYIDYIGSIFSIVLFAQKFETMDKNVDIIEVKKPNDIELKDPVSKRVEKFCNGMSIAKEYFETKNKKINLDYKLKTD